MFVSKANQPEKSHLSFLIYGYAPVLGHKY